MSVDWQAFRDGQIAVTCHSQEECEAFLCEAVKQQIPMHYTWREDICGAAGAQWLRTEGSYGDWYGVAYGFSDHGDLGFCWPSWWTDRDYTLVNFDDADVCVDCTVDDFV